MFKVYIIDRVTKAATLLEDNLTEEQATKFCEEWGWFYTDENGKTYWLDIEEIVS